MALWVHGLCTVASSEFTNKIFKISVKSLICYFVDMFPESIEGIWVWKENENSEGIQLHFRPDKTVRTFDAPKVKHGVWKYNHNNKTLIWFTKQAQDEVYKFYFDSELNKAILYEPSMSPPPTMAKTKNVSKR